MNLMDFIWSGDDIEICVGYCLIILHLVDLWPNSKTQGYFQFWHPPLSYSLHI